MTATGREAGRALYGDTVVQAWLPYDVPFAVHAFLERFQPRAGLLLETELWPNLIVQARARGTRMFLVNARMSEKSAIGYARFASLTTPMLNALAGVAAQTPGDAARLTALGAREVATTGNLKFDVAIPPEAVALGRELRVRFGADRPIWIAASTRDGEEAMLLDAIARSPMPEGTLTVIVPRHPQRFAVVAALLRERGLPFIRRSAADAVPGDFAVVLGDSMGEMLAYYAAADVAFVGGSLLPLGGQNLIEPIAMGVPTLVGPHTFNFAEAADQAIAAGAARRIGDAGSLVAEVAALLRNPGERAAMSDRARAFHAAHRGAADRLWAWLAPRLNRRAAD
jgi:3-deoxy-D-manno-octulosonic-acid transferase